MQHEIANAVGGFVWTPPDLLVRGSLEALGNARQITLLEARSPLMQADSREPRVSRAWYTRPARFAFRFHFFSRSATLSQGSFTLFVRRFFRPAIDLSRPRAIDEVPSISALPPASKSPARTDRLGPSPRNYSGRRRKNRTALRPAKGNPAGNRASRHQMACVRIGFDEAPVFPARGPSGGCTVCQAGSLYEESPKRCPLMKLSYAFAW
jgi:hypothetical protein